MLSPWQPQDVAVSYDLYSEVRERHLLDPTKRLSSTLAKPGKHEGNMKLIKTATSQGVAVSGRALAQGQSSGIEACPWRTAQCTMACLGEEGHYRFARNARVKAARTEFEYEYPHHAWTLYAHEIERDLRAATKNGWRLYWRPDILSDSQMWLKIPEFFAMFPGVTFYGYTKGWREALKYPGSWVLPNYKVAVSASERKTENVGYAISNGTNVAMVFDVDDGSQLPDSHRGIPVVDATMDDTWMVSHAGVIGGLIPIGWKMQQDTSGFVRRPERIKLGLQVTSKQDVLRQSAHDAVAPV